MKITLIYNGYMTKSNSLKIILIISIVGVLFSGFLSYRELFLGECAVGVISCGVNTPPIFGLPACVYGLVMYTLVLTFSVLGLRAKK